jgi:hypothetical protein
MSIARSAREVAWGQWGQWLSRLVCSRCGARGAGWVRAHITVWRPWKAGGYVSVSCLACGQRGGVTGPVPSVQHQQEVSNDNAF